MMVLWHFTNPKDNANKMHFFHSVYTSLEESKDTFLFLLQGKNAPSLNEDVKLNVDMFFSHIMISKMQKIKPSSYTKTPTQLCMCNVTMKILLFSL